MIVWEIKDNILKAVDFQHIFMRTTQIIQPLL